MSDSIESPRRKLKWPQQQILQLGSTVCSDPSAVGTENVKSLPKGMHGVQVRRNAMNDLLFLFPDLSYLCKTSNATLFNSVEI
jgi:hypothetical protein